MCEIKVTGGIAIERKKELADLVSLSALHLEFTNYQVVVWKVVSLRNQIQPQKSI